MWVSFRRLRFIIILWFPLLPKEERGTPKLNSPPIRPHSSPAPHQLASTSTFWKIGRHMGRPQASSSNREFAISFATAVTAFSSRQYDWVARRGNHSIFDLLQLLAPRVCLVFLRFPRLDVLRWDLMYWVSGNSLQGELSKVSAFSSHR